MTDHQFSAEDAQEWDTDGVAVWLGLIGLKTLTERFHDNDVDGKALLALDEEALHDMGLDAAAQTSLLRAIDKLRKTERAASANAGVAWNSDSDSDGAALPADSPEKHAPAGLAKRGSNIKTTAATVKDKKSDPLRIAAAGKSAVELSTAAVHTGFLYKLGGSGLKPKKW
jgi:hypothetical protein